MVGDRLRVTTTDLVLFQGVRSMLTQVGGRHGLNTSIVPLGGKSE